MPPLLFRGREPSSRLHGLCAALRDERSGQVVFLSHCLLNENTRYLGGAFRPGVVREVVEPYMAKGVGICQMPCPEQLAWGGVLKRRLLTLYARPRLRPCIAFLLPVMLAYTKLRYWRLAHQVAGQIADYQDAGFEVVGVVGVDASPTCGVSATLDLRTSLNAAVNCPLEHLDRAFMNENVVNGSATRGRGLFMAALSETLGRRGRHVPLLQHDLRSEQPGSPPHAGVTPVEITGRRPGYRTSPG